MDNKDYLVKDLLIKQAHKNIIRDKKDILMKFLPKEKRGAIIILIGDSQKLSEKIKSTAPNINFYHEEKIKSNPEGTSLAVFFDLPRIKDIFDKYEEVIKKVKEYDLKKEFVVIFEINNRVDSYVVQIK